MWVDLGIGRISIRESLKEIDISEGVVNFFLVVPKESKPKPQDENSTAFCFFVKRKPITWLICIFPKAKK